MVTKEMIIEALNKQTIAAESLINKMKDEGDLKFFENISGLEKVVKINALLIEKTNWNETTKEDLQHWYNTLIAWEKDVPFN